MTAVNPIGVALFMMLASTACVVFAISLRQRALLRRAADRLATALAKDKGDSLGPAEAMGLEADIDRLCVRLHSLQHRVLA